MIHFLPSKFFSPWNRFFFKLQRVKRGGITLLDILVRNMLYLLLRRWSIIFELFFPEISDKRQSRRAPNDLCDLYATFRFLFRSNVQVSNSSFQSFVLTLPVFLGNPASARWLVTGGNIRLGGFVCLVARKSKLFDLFCYHSGKDFGLLPVLIPTGVLAQIDRHTSKDPFCELKSFN